MLRAVTLYENDIRDHTGFTRSSAMRFPGFGARGSMSVAGVSLSVAPAAESVAASVIATDANPAVNASGASTGVSAGGAVYIVVYACHTVFGRTCEPTSMPPSAPATLAIPA